MAEREMKDSGVKWVHSIPNNWLVHPVSYYFSERKNKNVGVKEDNLLSLSYGQIIQKDINTSEGLLPASFSTYNIIEAGDIIIRPTDLQNDKRSLRTGLATERGIITSAYIDLAPRRTIDSRYFHYLLHTYDVMKVFYNMGNGVRQGLNYEEFGRLIVFEPPISEQHRIADFLDSKCSKINEISRKIQEEIDTLEEYKKSVITEAVTKGLDPNVEMKDSGVEWIGRVPSHWVMKKIKNACAVIGSGTTPKSNNIDYYDGAINWIQSGDLYKNPIIKQVSTTVTENAVKFNNSLKVYKAPYIVVAMYGASVGNTSISMIDACCNQACCCIKTNNQNDLTYMFYWINHCKSNFLLQAVGGGQPNISQEKIKNQVYFEPPYSEQCMISGYLERICNRINDSISIKQQQLSTLEEYKKSLIYEYVTGKKEVPDANA